MPCQTAEQAVGPALAALGEAELHRHEHGAEATPKGTRSNDMAHAGAKKQRMADADELRASQEEPAIFSAAVAARRSRR